VRGKLNSRGFTLTEAIVAIGIVSGLMAVFSSFSTSTFGLFNNMEKSQAVAIAFEDIRLVIKNNQFCTLNLKGTALTMSQPTGAQVTQIRSFDKDLQPISIVAQIAQTNKGLTLSDMRLIPVAFVDDSLMVSNLEMTFLKSSGGHEQSVTRLIPVYARVQNGQVTQCWQRLDQGTVEANQACLVMSGGALNTFDIVTGECKLANGRWFKGTSRSATCPRGTYLPKGANAGGNCAFETGPNFVETFTGSVRTLTDGSSVPFSRPPVITQLDSGTATCHCEIATDLPAEQITSIECSILCMVP
jgi:type II secretory pathway pseudopilin PulG